METSSPGTPMCWALAWFLACHMTKGVFWGPSRRHACMVMGTRWGLFPWVFNGGVLSWCLPQELAAPRRSGSEEAFQSDGSESLQRDVLVDVFVLFPEAAPQTFTALLHTFQRELTHAMRPNESFRNSCPRFPSPPYLPKKLMGCECRNRKQK